MTNGEKIKVAFPHYDIEIDEHKGYVRVFYEDFYTTYPLRWWNAEYKEPITKNDLGVDCIDRAEVNQVIEDYIDEQYNVLSDRTRERAFGAKAVKARINELPSVTPQEPRKDEVILTKEEYGELVSSEFDNGYAKGYREALEQEPILDKIRAEIDKARFIDKDTRICKNALASGLEVAMQIIDRYIKDGKVNEI